MRSSVSGTVICFMCQGHVPYTKNNMTKFEKHMATDHSAFFGMEYLLAGCKMSEDERLAVTDVVTEKEGGSRANSAHNDVDDEQLAATLEEGEVDNNDIDNDPLSNVVNVKKERVLQKQKPYKCDYCAKSFTLLDNLEEHISRRHPGQAKKSAKALKLQRGFQKQIQIKSSMSIVKTQKKKSMQMTQHRQDIPEGEGFPCGECGRVYKTEAMQKFHYTDVHVQGHFPCRGDCGKIFTSKNKMSSHWSRHCNPNNRKRNSL